MDCVESRAKVKCNANDELLNAGKEERAATVVSMLHLRTLALPTKKFNFIDFFILIAHNGWSLKDLFDSIPFFSLLILIFLLFPILAKY